MAKRVPILMTSHLLLIGLNHATAPVDVREQLTLTGDGLRLALKAIHELNLFREAVILATCNRYEIYQVAENAELARDHFFAFVRHFYGLEPDFLDGHLYHIKDDAAVVHLMRVAAGLESMVLGESQILGQVALAHNKARSTGAARTLLNRLFEFALRAGKRARSETDIGRRTTSVSHAAALLAREKLGDLTGVQALIIGAGEMATQSALALCQHGVGNVICMSRTIGNAQKLADRVGGRVANWMHLPNALSDADVVISATSAPHVVLRTANVVHALAARRGRPLLIVDIAVPRDVEETVGDLDNVELYDIDDLESVIDDNLTRRQAAIPQVEAIIEEETAAFQTWLHSREVVPTIVEMRRRAQAVAETELEKTLVTLDGAPADTEDALYYLAHRIVQKLLHGPTTCLKAHAQSTDSIAYTQVVRELFSLDGKYGE